MRHIAECGSEIVLKLKIIRYVILLIYGISYLSRDRLFIRCIEHAALTCAHVTAGRKGRDRPLYRRKEREKKRTG